jgi:hypothetical protein
MSPISGGSSLTPKAVRDYIFGENALQDLNGIVGAIPAAGTMPAGATLFNGYHNININVGAVNQWAGVDYVRLVLVYGYRIRFGPNPNPAAGRYRIQYQDPWVIAPTLIDMDTNIPAEDNAWSDYVELAAPIILREARCECTTYDADADLIQEVELRGILLE